MPDPDIIRILRSKTKLTDDEIIKLSNNKAWQEIYKAEAEERERKEKLRKPEICFTGFDFEEREKLETDATLKGLKVRTKVTKLLAYLVLGDMPGEKKIEQAEEQGVQILTIDEYEKLDSFVKKPKPKKINKKTTKITNKTIKESQPQYLEEGIYEVKKNRKSFILKHWWVWIIWLFAMAGVLSIPLPEIVGTIIFIPFLFFPLIYLIYWVIQKVVKR